MATLIIVSIIIAVTVMAVVAVAAWVSMGAWVALLIALLAGLITCGVCISVCIMAKWIITKRKEQKENPHPMECMYGKIED